VSGDPGRALLRDRTPAELRDLVTRAVGIGVDFAAGHSRDGRVLKYASEKELIQRFAEPFPVEGSDDNALLGALDEVARWSVAQHDQRYLAFPDSGSSVAGLAAGIVGMFLNQNLIAFDRSAPAGSVIEAQLISWLRELVGYPADPLTEYDGLHRLGGMWTSGGNMSNHVAIATALAATWPQVRTSGLQALPERPVIVLARGVEHFSYLGAAQVLGLGSAGMLWTAPTSHHTSDVDAVAAALANPPAGTRPFMVVGVAGNCRTTGIDQLDALADLCAEHALWFHVDACHGGSLLFSDQFRGQVAGIERSDSVSLDPHKGLFVTYPSSYVLVRDPTNLARFARYPEKATDPACLDLGLITPFYGSRGFDSLRLWAVIKHLGRSGIAALVEARQVTFGELRQLLESTGYFAMIGTSDFYRCAFVYCPPPAATLIARLRTRPELRDPLRVVISRYTRCLCQRLYSSGEVVFDLFALQDLGDVLGLGAEAKLDVMGMCVGHPAVDRSVREEIRRQVVAAAEDFVRPMVDDLLALEDGPAEEGGSSTVHGPAGW
jgi:glutamate/tyrosine decarboxylase-like PLP-dependent enzyme